MLPEYGLDNPRLLEQGLPVDLHERHKGLEDVEQPRGAAGIREIFVGFGQQAECGLAEASRYVDHNSAETHEQPVGLGGHFQHVEHLSTRFVARHPERAGLVGLAFFHFEPFETHDLTDPEGMTAVDYTAMPHAIFTSPQIAAVGKTEQQLREEGVPYAVGRYEYIDTGIEQALEDRTGFVKILAHRETRKILGCHILGTDASTLIHEVIVAMKSGDGSLGNLIRAVHIHPALSEVVQRAAHSVSR